MIQKINKKISKAFERIRMKIKLKYVILFLLSTIVSIALDQISKYLVVSNNIDFIKNYGAGFGIFYGQRILLISISLLASILLVYYYKNLEEDILLHLAYGLILGGTISNLIDRLMQGFVVDFIEFIIPQIFNIADASICIGAAYLVFYYWKN